MTDPVDSGGFPTWFALLLVLLAIVGVALATGGGDPVGYARAEEAKAAASVDIAAIVADLQRDIATMENENKRLALALEYQDRAADRAMRDRWWSVLAAVAIFMAASGWVVGLMWLGASATGSGKKKKKK